MTARDLFERAGCNACAVAFRGEEVCVYARGLETYIPAPEWERYKALCARWHAAGVDAPAASTGCPPQAVMQVLRELQRLAPDIAAAGTCMDLDDVADALADFGRRVDGMIQALRELEKGGAA